MSRLSDWEQRLYAYLDDTARKMEAGEVKGSDQLCALFAAGAAQAQTGEDPRKEFRGRYSYVRDNLEAAFGETFPTIPPSFARRGDLAFHDGSVGVVTGAEALFVGDVDGKPMLVSIPRTEWVKAWAVG